jgi:hypothetical protein
MISLSKDELIAKVDNACYYIPSEYINSKDAMAYRDGLIAGRAQAVTLLKEHL